MKYTEEEKVYAFCDDRDGNGGCGATSSLLPEEFEVQHCWNCGKNSIIVKVKAEVEIICPNGHCYIEKHHKHCVVCGEKLNVKKSSSIQTITRKEAQLS